MIVNEFNAIVSKVHYTHPSMDSTCIYVEYMIRLYNNHTYILCTNLYMHIYIYITQYSGNSHGNVFRGMFVRIYWYSSIKYG